MPKSTYGSPEHRRSQYRRHWAYYVTQYGRTAFNLGSKAIQAAKSAAAVKAAEFGYGLGKQFVNSFSQKKNTNTGMAPTPRKTPSTPKRRSKPRLAGTPIKRKAKMANPFVDKALKTVARRRYAGRGAANSSSSGFFKKPKRGPTVMDDYGKLGVISTRENGGTVEGSALFKYQSVLLHHSTNGCKQILTDMCLAFAKRLAYGCGTVIERMNDPFLHVASRNYRIVIDYRPRPNVATVQQTFGPYTAGTATVLDIGNAILAWLDGEVDALINFQLIRATVYFDGVATTPAVGSEQICSLDLKRATVSMISKSALKLQNRSINATGNDEADDVDNVPLYGKSYDGPGNYFIVQETYYNPPVTVESNFQAAGFIATSPLAEPPFLTQMQHAKKSGKAHLDPGQIKTSVLNYSFTMDVNRLLNTVGRTDITSNICNIGKYRAFILEKMLQASPTTDTNPIRVAYETDIKVGTIFTAPKLQPTTMVVALSPL